MSKEAATKFLSRLAEDPALQDQARSLAKNAQDPVAAAVDLGSKQGFQFTGAEFLEVVQLAQKARGGQLADAELERVAGGLPNLSYRLSDAGSLFSLLVTTSGSPARSRTLVGSVNHGLGPGRAADASRP